MRMCQIALKVAGLPVLAVLCVSVAYAEDAPSAPGLVLRETLVEVPRPRVLKDGLKGTASNHAVRQSSEAAPAAARMDAAAVPSGGARLVDASEKLALFDAVGTALDRNGKLLAAKDDISAARAVVWQQIASFVPVVTASMGRGKDYNTSITNHYRKNRYVSAQMTVPLFTSGQRLFNWSRANSLLAAAEAESDLAANEIALEMVSAHINYVSAGRVTELIGRNVKTMERLLAAVRAKQREGFASDTDRAQVLADLKSLQEQLAGARADRAKAEETVVSLVGAHVRDNIDVPALEKQVAVGEEELVERAITFNPSLLSAERQADAARYNSLTAVSQLLPQITLNAEANRDYAPISHEIDRDDWTVEVRGTVPLVDLGSVGEVARSRYVASAAAHRASDARRSVELEVRTLWQDFTAAKRQAELARSRVADRRQVSNSLEEQYKLGMVSLDVMLDRQRLLTQSELELQQIEVQRAVTLFRLLLTTGRFSPEMLG